ncbi:MAG: ASKHA domain-containing protein, partial [bacterium]
AFLGSMKKEDANLLREKFGIGAEDITIRMSDPDLLDSTLKEDHGWKLGVHSNATVVVGPEGITGFEAGDTAKECYGIAMDIGTNTVVASLVDLRDGRELGIASSINPQVIHGDDVISRIRFAKTSGGLEMLRHEINHLMNGMMLELTRDLGVEPRRVYVCSLAGNTAMQHIVVGVSPVDLGRAPYRAKLMSAVETLASKSGVEAHHDCRLLMPPSLGGFVGGDITALIISQALHRKRVPTLAVDLGTNGEIVLAANNRLLVCSTAAGPAFEGERISCGVRAIGGAIEDVRIRGRKIDVTTIGEKQPVGICGSGLVAAAGELRRAGIIEPSGRIRTPDQVKARWLAGRIIEGERGREFILVDDPLIKLTQGDIREVQLGKAAICAGIKVLLSGAGLKLADLRTILIAGSFGSSVRPASIKALGILPPEFSGRIKVVGNTAIEGAKIFLTSAEARAEAREVARLAEHVELFTRPEFNEEFYASMGFPEL